MKYDDIKAIKSVFPQGKCSTTSNRMKDVYAAETEGVEDTLPEDHEDENDVFQVVADQFQNQERRAMMTKKCWMCWRLTRTSDDDFSRRRWAEATRHSRLHGACRVQCKAGWSS